MRVHNNVIWNAEPGNAIELGYALQSEIHDLVFEDVILSTASTKEIWAVLHFLSIRQTEATFMTSIIKISE